jgi:hypothetical protein
LFVHHGDRDRSEDDGLAWRNVAMINSHTINNGAVSTPQVVNVEYRSDDADFGMMPRNAGVIHDEITVNCSAKQGDGFGRLKSQGGLTTAND